jgi:hypothetical protein
MVLAGDLNFNLTLSCQFEFTCHFKLLFFSSFFKIILMTVKRPAISEYYRFSRTRNTGNEIELKKSTLSSGV